MSCSRWMENYTMVQPNNQIVFNTKINELQAMERSGEILKGYY